MIGNHFFTFYNPPLQLTVVWQVNISKYCIYRTQTLSFHLVTCYYDQSKRQSLLPPCLLRDVNHVLILIQSWWWNYSLYFLYLQQKSLSVAAVTAARLQYFSSVHSSAPVCGTSGWSTMCSAPHWVRLVPQNTPTLRRWHSKRPIPRECNGVSPSAICVSEWHRTAEHP